MTGPSLIPQMPCLLLLSSELHWQSPEPLQDVVRTAIRCVEDEECHPDGGHGELLWCVEYGGAI